jgi:hypothetical protein
LETLQVITTSLETSDEESESDSMEDEKQSAPVVPVRRGTGFGKAPRPLFLQGEPPAPKTTNARAAPAPAPASGRTALTRGPSQTPVVAQVIAPSLAERPSTPLPPVIQTPVSNPPRSAGSSSFAGAEMMRWLETTYLTLVHDAGRMLVVAAPRVGSATKAPPMPEGGGTPMILPPPPQGPFLPDPERGLLIGAPSVGANPMVSASPTSGRDHWQIANGSPNPSGSKSPLPASKTPLPVPQTPAVVAIQAPVSVDQKGWEPERGLRVGDHGRHVHGHVPDRKVAEDHWRSATDHVLVKPAEKSAALTAQAAPPQTVQRLGPLTPQGSPTTTTANVNDEGKEELATVIRAVKLEELATGGSATPSEAVTEEAVRQRAFKRRAQRELRNLPRVIPCPWPKCQLQFETAEPLIEHYSETHLAKRKKEKANAPKKRQRPTWSWVVKPALVSEADYWKEPAPIEHPTTIASLKRFLRADHHHPQT